MTDSPAFDVFLSHSSRDKPAIEALAKRLEDEAHLTPWLDQWHLVPGEPWQEALEQALDASRTCAVFIGPSGIGPWENEEMRSALQTRVNQTGFRVVPVLLPGATMPERGLLPRFLSRLTWVDFRSLDGLHDAEAFQRLVAGIRGIPPGRSGRVTSPGAMAIDCPYRGLEVFDEAHARFFFGREALTQHLVESLRTTRCLAVLGPSGSGKSSLVRAGLLPQLRTGALPGSDRWGYFVFKPGAHPLHELALALGRAEPSADVLATTRRVLTSLEADERTLHLHVRLALASQPSEARCCLVVDQFEEIFTLCHERPERVRFIDNLRYAATVAEGRTVVLLTMRLDFMPHAAEYTDLAELLSGHQFLVSPMDTQDLQRAIEEPARVAGLTFEAGLVDIILDDVGDEPGRLPLLEDTLLQVWEQRREDQVMTLQAYGESGGVQGALAKRADAIFQGFAPAQQVVTRRLLLRLTQPGEGTEDTRRRAAMIELWTRPEEQGAVEQVVQQFVGARLLTTSVDASGQRQVDVAHEALIRGWPRLRRWIEEDRAALRRHRRITEAAQEWQRMQRDESVLFRGARLAQAHEWRAQHDEDLNDLERAFLDASIARQEQEVEAARKRQRQELAQAQALAAAQQQRAEEQASATRRLRRRAIGLAAVALLAVGTAVFAWLQRQAAQTNAQLAIGRATESNRLRRISLAQALATQALRQHDQRKDDRSALLARQAYLFNQQHSGHVLDQVDDALRTVLSAPYFSYILRDEGWVMSVAFSPDGQRLATGRWDGTVRLWELRQPTAAPTILRHEATVRSVAFSPDGERLASGSQDGTVRLWDVRQPANAPTILRHEGWVMSVAFSPNGDRLAAGSDDKTVRLWDVRQPANAPTSLRHEGEVLSVAFSPDGERLASGSADRAVRLWDVRQPANAPTILRHEGEVLSVAFSPDGERLASGSTNGTIRIWIVRTDILAEMVCQKVWRNLTLDEWRPFVGADIPYEPTCPNRPSGDGVPPEVPAIPSPP